MVEREVIKTIRLTPEELQMIQKKMKQYGTQNFSAFVRKMAIDGYVVRLELPELKEMVSLLRYSSNNLNQLTKRVHETGRIYDADLEDLRQTHERLWDAENGLYVDYDVVNHTRSKIQSSAGFLPLLSGAPTPAMAKRLVATLKDPERFATPFAVPSISRSQPEFYSKDMWRGPVWININYLIARGLERYGFREEAETLIGSTMAELEKFYFKYGTFFEFYDDRCGCDPPELLRKNACDADLSPYHQAFMDYGWSAALYIDMVFEQAKSKAAEVAHTC